MEYSIEKIDETSINVLLSGTINEDSEMTLQGLYPFLESASRLVFNFEKITSINSLGIRTWVTFLRKIQQPQRQVIFSHCTNQVINQMNMIANFRGNSEIASFYTNYVCSCGNEKKLLVETKQLAPGTHPSPPQCPCGKETMEMEELEDEYFAFLH